MKLCMLLVAALATPAASLRVASLRTAPVRAATPTMGINIRPYDKLLNVAAPYVVPLLVQKGSVVFKPLYSVHAPNATCAHLESMISPSAY